jgi:hypothetical protein
MSEKADFEAEVKAVEEFQKVSHSSEMVSVLMISNPVSRGLFDHIPPLMSSRKGAHYLSSTLLM